MKKKRCLVFDFDGTLFNAELLAANTADYQEGEIFTSKAIPRINFQKFSLKDLVYPEVMATLEQFQKEGWSFLLFSSGDREGQKYKLEELSDLSDFFPQEDRFIFADKTKPDSMVQLLDSIPSSATIWLVDDKPEVLRAIKNFDQRIKTVLIRRGKHWQKALADFKADYEIDDLIKLKELL